MPAFSELALSEGCQKVVAELGYSQLTPIQAAGIPPLLDGKDLIGQSRTGSGKTAAFSIPILEKIDTTKKEIQALVLSPTRELCLQVAREIRKLGRYQKDLQVLTLFGGHPVYLDLKPLKHGAPHIIVGTPGRLLDHIERKSIDLSTAKVVVLDEADRMLDMGFRDTIEAILKNTTAERQTALFSATFPVTIEGLSKKYMRSPIRVTIETSESDIEQICYMVRPEEKTNALVTFLKNRALESTLVFCNLKVVVDEIHQALRKAGYSADKLHGDLEQREREQVMAKFRNSSIRILVATDVAARGIDVAGLDAVINFDMPSDPAHYVHRIGRTGRAGKKGLAISFVTDKESFKLTRIKEETQYDIPVERGVSLKKVSATTEISAKTMDTLSISGGRKEKLRAGDILGALTGDAGIGGDDVGKIEILDHVSYVAIARSSSKEALARLKDGKIKGRKFLVNWVN